jgi:hypothetical protein
LLGHSLLLWGPTLLINSRANPTATDGTLDQLRRFAGHGQCSPTLQSSIPGLGGV